MRSRWVLWAKAQQHVQSPAAVAVLLEIADHANATGECFPSIARIATATRLHERTVQRQIGELERLGLLKREIGGGWIAKGKGRTNRVHLIDRQEAGASPESACDAESTAALCRGRSEATPAQCHCSSESAFTENIEEFGRLPRHNAGGSEVSKKEGGGGSAHTHTHEPARGATIIALRRSDPAASEIAPCAEPAAAQEPTDREHLLAAMGHDPTGLTATGKFVGNAEDMAEARRWRSDLELTVAEQLEVVRSVMTAKRDGPPNSFRYFRPAMQRFAAQKREPKLQPISLTNFKGKRANEHSSNAERVMRRVMAAARGTSGDDWPQG